MDQKKVGAFLKELRKEKSMTQEQLAEYLNVSVRTVSRWETGSNMPDLDILIILSDYYEVDIKDLLEGERSIEKMNTEPADAVQKAADYARCKEKMLIKKVCGVTISGIIAWGVSFILVLRFITVIRGVECLFVGALLGVLLYSILTFSVKANRTTDGYMTSLIGVFAAIITSNIILLVLFFSTGSYYNYGIRGVYYSLIVFVLTFSASGAVTTVLNKKREQKKTAK
ncbi:MAG: helix-turn-helix domain-containing protein [Oscillospiraceae bacterium]